MTKAKITKISDNKNALRTDSMEGFFLESPQIDKPFTIFGESLDPIMSARVVITSPVKSIEDTGNKVIINTQNSTYQLDLL